MVSTARTPCIVRSTASGSIPWPSAQRVQIRLVAAMLSTSVPSMSKRKAAKVRSVNMAGPEGCPGSGGDGCGFSSDGASEATVALPCRWREALRFHPGTGEGTLRSGKGNRMSSAAELVIKAALVGIGGTIVLDLWALFTARIMGLPATNWAMVG